MLVQDLVCQDLSDPKTGWGMDCYMAMGTGSASALGSGSSAFFQPKLVVSSPSVEVYSAGCCGGVPVILTKTIQASLRRKVARHVTLDAIPEDEEVDKEQDIVNTGDGFNRLRKVQMESEVDDYDESEMKMGQRYYPGEMYVDEDGQLSWFNAGVRVGVGIGLGMCLGVGIGVGLLMRSYQAFLLQATTEIRVGFIKEAPALAVCGYNIYHKNRLIRPFWKVTMDGSAIGNGVVGVLEANFIEPAHDKQDFERSSLFQRLEARLKRIVTDYWNSHCHVFGYKTSHLPADKSKRIPIPHQPPTSNTFNPLRSPSDKFSQGGPIIREISLSNATSVRTVAVPPPHMRNSTGLRSNFQPVQLNPQPAVTDTRNNLAGKSVYEIRQENLQLFGKCEEYVKKETEMEQTVRKLEKELEEARSKCAQLALLVDAKKKEMQQV